MRPCSCQMIARLRPRPRAALGLVGVNAAATTAKRAGPVRSKAFSAIRYCQLPARTPYVRAERDIRLPKLFESAMLPLPPRNPANVESRENHHMKRATALVGVI